MPLPMAPAPTSVTLAGRECLLVDADEAFAIVRERVNFDQVVTVKRLYWEQDNASYHHITAVGNAE